MKSILLIAALIGLLVLALAAGGAMWMEAGDVAISLNGVIALVLGTLVALGLGIGLMALVFYSSRHGHDDQAGR